MRITQNMLATQILTNITGSLNRLAKAQEQLSTAKRINRASDDPLGSSTVLRLQAIKGRLQSFQQAIDAAQSSLTATATPLERVTELLQQARDIAVQGSSDTMSGSRGSLAKQVNQLLEELLSQANTRFGDRYVFAGIQTSTPAYTATRDADGNITTVTANPLGVTGVIHAQIAEGVMVQTNLPGDQAFTQTVDLFNTLVGLRDALAADDTPSIAASIDALANGIKQVDATSGVVGVVIRRLESERTNNQQDLTRVESLRSNVQDADINEVYMQTQNLQNAFQASLVAGAKAIQPSLLDFLQ